MMITVCMIVKNEEDMLAECLHSVKDADEIVVCDTGSTDGTINIARRYGAKICHYEWTDHFADARNVSLKEATGDYILVIDADEQLESGGIEMLRMFRDEPAYWIKIYACDGKWEHDAVRYFKNSPDAKFVGRLHETLNLTPVQRVPVGITAYHSPAHAKDPDRNIRILERCLLDEPNKPRWLYYLGREFYYRRNYIVASHYFNDVVRYSNWNAERTDAWLYIARCAWLQHRGHDARQACLQALGTNPNFKEAARFMAEMSWEHNKAPWTAMALAGTNEGVIFRRYEE